MPEARGLQQTTITVCCYALERSTYRVPLSMKMLSSEEVNDFANLTILEWVSQYSLKMSSNALQETVGLAQNP